MKTKTGSNLHTSQLLALPNHFPYNEMLFDGKLKLGDFAVKTRSYDPGFRGPVLLYTSGRIANWVANRHDYNPKEYVRPAVVGIGNLDHVEQLSERELESLLQQFFNDPKETTDQWLGPSPYGLFFDRLKRFDEPIPFTAKPGPVRMIKVPVSKVSEALGKNGFGVLEGKLVYL